MSSSEKKHDFHLVDPSPWPIYTSFSCLVLAIGSVYYFHTEVSIGMYLGLALLISSASKNCEKTGNYNMLAILEMDEPRLKINNLIEFNEANSFNNSSNNRPTISEPPKLLEEILK